jgi:hypothetical protein
VVYSSVPEHERQFEALRAKALKAEAAPLDMDSVNRARPHMEEAMAAYAHVVLGEDLGSCREWSGRMFICLLNGICALNNRYFLQGDSRRFEEMADMRLLPQGFILGGIP